VSSGALTVVAIVAGVVGLVVVVLFLLGPRD
jgi:L-serine deaminase